MKKRGSNWLIMLLAVVTCACFSSCNNNEEEEGDENANNPYGLPLDFLGTWRQIEPVQYDVIPSQFTCNGEYIRTVDYGNVNYGEETEIEVFRITGYDKSKRGIHLTTDGTNSSMILQIISLSPTILETVEVNEGDYDHPEALHVWVKESGIVGGDGGGENEPEPDPDDPNGPNGPDGPDDPIPGGDGTPSIVGTWKCQCNTVYVLAEFKANGDVTIAEYKNSSNYPRLTFGGKWQLTGSSLVINYDDGDTETYDIVLGANNLHWELDEDDLQDWVRQ